MRGWPCGQQSRPESGCTPTRAQRDEAAHPRGKRDRPRGWPCSRSGRERRALPGCAGGADAREPHRGGTALEGTVRRSTRPDGRSSRARNHGEVTFGRQEGGKATPPRKQGSAREGEGRAHRPVAGSAGRGCPERRGRGSTPCRTPHWSGRLCGGRHHERPPTVAVTRIASASTARAVTSSERETAEAAAGDREADTPAFAPPRVSGRRPPALRLRPALGCAAPAQGGRRRPSRSARARAAASGSSPRCSRSPRARGRGRSDRGGSALRA